MAFRDLFSLLFSMTISLTACDLFSSRPVFDGQMAFQNLEKQCSFGPRNPGSKGHAACLSYLTDELKKYCHTVTHQKFNYTDKRDTTKSFEGTNVIASLNVSPEIKERILICAHWDTRPWADKDPVAANRQTPILGANDGASGVAVILELARILKNNPPEVGVDFILFDLEDYGDQGWEKDPEHLNSYCIGSKYYASQNKKYFPKFGILLDMIGDKNLDLPIEYHSFNSIAKETVLSVWDIAKSMDKPAFREAVEPAIYDDHIPLLEIGMKVINIIDFSYPDATNRFHHSTHDIPANCSAESLQQVGDVLVEVIYSQ